MQYRPLNKLLALSRVIFSLINTFTRELVDKTVEASYKWTRHTDEEINKKCLLMVASIIDLLHISPISQIISYAQRHKCIKTYPMH